MAIGDITNVNSYTYHQWDIGQNLWIDPEYSEYIFLFGRSENEPAYVSRANLDQTEDGMVAVPIPNIVLQKSGQVSVYYCNGTTELTGEQDEYGNDIIRIGNLKTIAKQTIVVEPKAKPDNYVYSKEDLLTYATYGETLNILNSRVMVLESYGIQSRLNRTEDFCD
jgi:hypothetical protein